MTVCRPLHVPGRGVCQHADRAGIVLGQHRFRRIPHGQILGGGLRHRVGPVGRRGLLVADRERPYRPDGRERLRDFGGDRRRTVAAVVAQRQIQPSAGGSDLLRASSRVAGDHVHRRRLQPVDVGAVAAHEGADIEPGLAALGLVGGGEVRGGPRRRGRLRLRGRRGRLGLGCGCGLLPGARRRARRRYRSAAPAGTAAVAQPTGVAPTTAVASTATISIRTRPGIAARAIVRALRPGAR